MNQPPLPQNRFKPDTIIALLSLIATVIFGIASLFSEQEKPLFLIIFIATLVIFVLASISVIVASRLRQQQFPALSSAPYQAENTVLTADIHDISADNSTITREETIIVLSDYYIAHMYKIYGDGNRPPVSDVRCLLPTGARFVDEFAEHPQMVYLLSLRRKYRKNDKFSFKVQFDVQGGFPNPDREGLISDVPVKMTSLTLKALLPVERYYISQSLELEILNTQGAHTTLLPDECVTYTANGRQQILYMIKNPVVGYEYRMWWKWANK